MKDRLKLRILNAKEDLKSTRGVCGSGTIACRLWGTLNAVIECVEETDNTYGEMKFRTLEQLDAFWRACGRTPILPNTNADSPKGDKELKCE